MTEHTRCAPNFRARFFSTLAILFLLACISPAARSTDERILLIARPQLWSRPDRAAGTTASAWRPGLRLQVLAKQGAGTITGQSTDEWFQVTDGSITGWLPDAYLDARPPDADPAKLGAIGGELVDRFHGIAPEYAPTDLESVGPRQDPEVNYRLRREAAQALKAMFRAAKADGVKLLVVSAYRSWDKQQELYERRVRENGGDQGSVAKPGHSEHQLGTAVDLTDGDKANLLKESFGDTPAGRWLREHAWEYGFAISFTRHNQPQTGCIPEPWHYRYWGIVVARTKHLGALGECGPAK